ncbi:helix-turn-helix domain-containing protein [Nocardia tengchongensis]|uniref:Helix-turn-helix domain-containing protein n=1 Tax=Nocardia tengchongensis TaxID=2055889 RepID=A0ABX8CT69_9NOCA|nr:helix-turn-helix domain-containing protein [Nocardia tengchongensis]QVI21385.1 helix-turn-helix domain-containing protein [Nocardia tengchongensis]
MTSLDIAEVVRRSGVPASTLRYYEERGLIASTGRRGLRRQFDSSVLEHLALIALGRTAGFSLDDIVLVFGPPGDLRVDRALLTGKADELDRTIMQLTAVRDSLRHAAACPAPSHAECPSFRRILSEVIEGRMAAADASAPKTPRA